MTTPPLPPTAVGGGEGRVQDHNTLVHSYVKPRLGTEPSPFGERRPVTALKVKRHVECVHCGEHLKDEGLEIELRLDGRLHVVGDGWEHECPEGTTLTWGEPGVSHQPVPR